MAGKAWKFGDDVDTDAIIPGRFLANWNKTPEKLKEHCFADMNPTFASQVQAGDFVVGGKELRLRFLARSRAHRDQDDRRESGHRAIVRPHFLP